MKTRVLQQRRVEKSGKRLMNPSTYIPTRVCMLEPQRILLISRRQMKISESTIEAMKKDLTSLKGLTENKLSKYYQVVFKVKANRSFTQKGILVRMGKGKGKITHVGTYLRPNQICIELYPVISPINYNLVRKLVCRYISKYTFLSMYPSI